MESERPLVGSPRNVIVDYKKLKEELSSERKNDYNRLLAQVKPVHRELGVHYYQVF